MLKQLLSLSLLIGITNVSTGQAVEDTISRTLWCPNDTFLLKFNQNPQRSSYRVSEQEEDNMGNDASPGQSVTVYYGQDSLVVKYHNNIPYNHNIYLYLASPKGKTFFRLHFNSVSCFFPQEYMTGNEGNVQFDIPETYELANIIWTLSPSGQRAKDLNKQGDYYERMLAWFKPYMDHPVLKALDFPDSVYPWKHFDFRENSFAFNFLQQKKVNAKPQLAFNGPYYYVYGDELADSSLFGKLKPLVEDFANQSGFRQFYGRNRDYYTSQIKRQQELLPVMKMWVWLEKEFPGRKYQSYRIVFSPLIGGSHSTQQYHCRVKGKWFSENVMFICGTDRYDNRKGLTEKQKEGLMSGIVFTEIDHNYINPVTNRYAALVDSIFSHRSTWVDTGTTSDYYNNSSSVFNEYMTHAAFCLYVQDTYEAAIADYVIKERENMMVERRRFILFKEFNRALSELRQSNKEKKLIELYPLILEWCRKDDN